MSKNTSTTPRKASACKAPACKAPAVVEAPIVAPSARRRVCILEAEDSDDDMVVTEEDKHLLMTQEQIDEEKRLEDLLEKNKEPRLQECPICYDNTTCELIGGCDCIENSEGILPDHLYICGECAPKITDCVMCRQRFL